MTDPLSVAAGITGLTMFAGATLTKGYSIVLSLQNSGKDVQQLLTELSQLTGVLVGIESQANAAKKNSIVVPPGYRETSKILDSSIIDCQKTVREVSEILEKLKKSRKAVLAVKWQFLEREIKPLIKKIKGHKELFILCMGVGTGKRADEVLDLQAEISLKLSDMKDEREKEKIEAQEERNRLDHQALLRWLVPKSDEKHAKACALQAPGTGNWVFERPDFIQWSESDSKLLWLNGIPGSGKTILMSHVIQRLRSRSSVCAKESGVAYYYFTYSENEKTSVAHILSSIAAQIIRYLPHPEAGAAMRLFKECDDGTLAPVSDKIRDLLLHMIPELKNVYICIDALDECGDDMKDELLLYLFLLMESCDNVKILVSSRTGESSVTETFGFCPSITVDSELPVSDMAIFVKHRIDHGPERLRRAQSEQIVRKLTEGAEGMFLWASCQIDHLSRIRTPAGVEQALSSLPRGLYSTYSRILFDIEPEDEFVAARTLRWLANPVSPLSLPQLVEAIAIEDHSSSLESLKSQRLHVPEDIFQICGSLVRYSESAGSLSLAHHSVYEFLTLPACRDRVPISYRLFPDQVAIDLASTCLTYLSFEDFNMSKIRSTLQLDTNIASIGGAQASRGLVENPFYEYALRSWFQHLLPHPGRKVPYLWPEIAKFFDSETGNFASSILVLRYLDGVYKYPFSMQPLHFCAIHGLPDVLDRILEHNSRIDPDCGVEDGRRALHIAAENDQEAIVSSLLLRRVDVNKRTLDGRNPLQFAMESGNESIAKLLISKGASLNANFAHGETPVSVAVANGWHSLARFLLRKGADPNGRLFDMRTSLHVAAEAGSDSDMFELLSDAGADQELVDEDDWGPQHLAAYYGHTVATLMLMGGRDPHHFFKVMGYTPLHFAVQEEHVGVIEILAPKFGRFVSENLTTLFAQHGGAFDPFGGPPPSPPARPKSPSLKAGSTGKPDPLIYYESKSSTSTTLPKIVRTPAPGDMSPDSPQKVPTPLWLATSQGFLAGVQLLNESGVTRTDRENCKKLAAEKGNLQVLDLLNVVPVEPVELA